MASPIEVSRFLIHLAAAEEEPEFLTHLRLQKLLYYAQGWSLALRGKSLFSSRIEAWKHGPVVRSVYRVFADYDWQPIHPGGVPEAEGLTAEEQDFLVALWERYKPFSASKLREMTHAEAPWCDARNGLDPLDEGNAEITEDALSRHFGPRAAEFGLIEDNYQRAEAITPENNSLLVLADQMPPPAEWFQEGN
jgi:uncharacterized phage-associated protein